MVARRILFAAVLISLIAFRAEAQSGHPITIRSLPPNVEICLGGVLDTSLSFTNLDPVQHSIRFSFEIRNVVTGIVVDSIPDTERSITSNATLVVPIHYVTNPNILSELGTFRVLTKAVALDGTGQEIAGTKDSVVTRLFGIRRTNSPWRDYSNNYGKTNWNHVPDQVLWTAYGATVVDGQSTTWDPPPPQGTFGKDNLNNPVIRLDRRDEYGHTYLGAEVGDTLTSFPINLQGQSQAVFNFDFMRGGKHSYTALWDMDTMYGPEQTVLGPTGAVARAGDSLILAFQDPQTSACNPTSWTRILAIDGGHDLTFKRLWMEIRKSDSTIVYRLNSEAPVILHTTVNYLDSNFRFRWRLKASDNAVSSSLVKADDDDPWYVDNISLTIPRLPELEMQWVRVVTPYTKLPISAAAKLPVYLNVSNHNLDIVINVPLRVTIADSQGNIFYANTVSLQSLLAGYDTVMRFPDWDAHGFRSGRYTLTGTLAQPGYQSESQIMQTSSTFYLNLDNDPENLQEFAYDDAGLSPAAGAGNDIPFLTQRVGSGVGFNQMSGSYAMKFELPQRDALVGARLYFGNLNQAGEPIRISLLADNPASHTPGDTITGVQSEFLGQREGGYFNQFWTYSFPQPITLQPGTYWLAVSQLSLDCMMLGGDVSRGGGSIIRADQTNPVIAPVYSDPYGTQWSPNDNSGEVSTAFAIERTAGSGDWQPWMPSVGYWPTNSNGGSQQYIALSPYVVPPYTRGGSFLPMIRVVMDQAFIDESGVAGSDADASSLESISPNPFNALFGTSAIHFSLAASARVSLAIYDAMGREVRMLLDAPVGSGEHIAHWDGRDESRQLLAPGAYFCRFTADGAAPETRMMLLQ